MANEHVCEFSGKLLAQNPYPKRVEDCTGGTVKIQDCKESIDMDHGERFVTLVRSGKIKQYHYKRDMYICEGHRYFFGAGFSREMSKYKRCAYPGLTPCTGKVSSQHVSMEQSKAWLDKNEIIFPYKAYLCKKCAFKISEFMKKYKEEKEEAKREEEEMETEDIADSYYSQPSSTNSQPYFDPAALDSDTPSLTGS